MYHEQNIFEKLQNIILIMLKSDKNGFSYALINLLRNRLLMQYIIEHFIYERNIVITMVRIQVGLRSHQQ